MRGGPNFHRFFRNVDVRQLLELVIHARELLLDVLLGLGQSLLDPGNVEKDAAMRTAASFTDFAHDASRDVITRE